MSDTKLTMKAKLLNAAKGQKASGKKNLAMLLWDASVFITHKQDEIDQHTETIAKQAEEIDRLTKDITLGDKVAFRANSFLREETEKQAERIAELEDLVSNFLIADELIHGSVNVHGGMSLMVGTMNAAKQLLAKEGE